MKFTIEKATLLKALDRAKSVTDAKSTMPILSHVRLEAEPDTLHGALHVGATDLFMSIETTVSCSVDEEGGVCLNAKDLYDRLKLMPDGDVKFTLSANSVTIKAAKAPRKFVLPGLALTEYPILPERKGDGPGVVWNDRELADKIDSAKYAISTDETRAYLNSLLFEENNGNLNLASTDGHRMAMINGNVSNGNKWLVPLKAVNELVKLCRESVGNKTKEHNVIFQPESANLFVHVNGFDFSCKLVEGSFPPVQSVIPTRWDHEIKIERDKFINTLKALVVATSDSKGVKLSFTENKLSIVAESVNGTGDDEIECEYIGGDNSYGVNAVYLLQALDPICTDKVVLKVSGSMDPILIEEDSKDSEYVAIVMPMRIG